MKKVKSDFSFHLNNDEEYTRITLVIMHDDPMSPEDYVGALKQFVAKIESPAANDIFYLDGPKAIH